MSDSPVGDSSDLRKVANIGRHPDTKSTEQSLTPNAIDCTLVSMQLLASQSETSSVRIADLILPVFAVILSGWIVGYTGYLSRTLSDALIHFAYNIAMPALLIVTIAQEPSHSLIRWRFLVAFGGGSLLCFLLVFGIMSIRASRSLASRTMHGMAASMTNTGFVALPVLQAIYGPRAVLPAAIATVFVAVVMFPTAVILLELGQRDAHGSRTAPMATVKHVVLNPMVRCAHALCTVRHRTGAVDRCIARQYWASFAALRRQARHHASDRVWIERVPGARPPLHHCGRNLRRGAHGQDGLHSCGRVSLRGNDGSVHCLADNSCFRHLARDLAL
jgi:hypothetical protein